MLTDSNVEFSLGPWNDVLFWVFAAAPFFSKENFVRGGLALTFVGFFKALVVSCKLLIIFVVLLDTLEELFEQRFGCARGSLVFEVESLRRSVSKFDAEFVGVLRSEPFVSNECSEVFDGELDRLTAFGFLDFIWPEIKLNLKKNDIMVMKNLPDYFFI